EEAASLPECPDLLKSLRAFTSPATWDNSVNVLVQLAASMRAHGHGGTLLVVPAEKEEWRSSIVHPIFYSVAPAYSKLSDLLKKGCSHENENEWQAYLRSAVEIIAGLTAVDGATV